MSSGTTTTTKKWTKTPIKINSGACVRRRCHHAYDCRRRANENRVGQVNGEESEGVHCTCIEIISMSTEARAMDVQPGAEQPLCDRNSISTLFHIFWEKTARKQQRVRNIFRRRCCELPLCENEEICATPIFFLSWIEWNLSDVLSWMLVVHLLPESSVRNKTY